MRTAITEMFDIEHPIIQGGMHYVGFAEMAWNGLKNGVMRPPAIVKHAVRVGRQIADQVMADGLDGVRSAPKSPFNGVVGSERSVAWIGSSWRTTTPWSRWTCAGAAPRSAPAR